MFLMLFSPYIDGLSFSSYKPLQNADFSKVVNMQCFSGIVLTRTHGEKFENMFLVKIASKGTSLRLKLHSK